MAPFWENRAEAAAAEAVEWAWLRTGGCAGEGLFWGMEITRKRQGRQQSETGLNMVEVHAVFDSRCLYETHTFAQ